MPYSKEEQAMFDAAKHGSLGAFERVLSLYERPLFNYVLRLVRHRQDAEDVTQETFIKFYRHLASLDAEKNGKALLYKIATNTAYDWLRKKKSRRELFIVDDPNVHFETIDPRSPYHERQAKEDAEVLERALGRIKPLHRSVLLLFYKQEFTYQEIAAILSLPLNTVKTALRRGKAALKNELPSSS